MGDGYLCHRARDRRHQAESHSIQTPACWEKEVKWDSKISHTHENESFTRRVVGTCRGACAHVRGRSALSRTRRTATRPTPAPPPTTTPPTGHPPHPPTKQIFIFSCIYFFLKKILPICAQKRQMHYMGPSFIKINLNLNWEMESIFIFFILLCLFLLHFPKN